MVRRSLEADETSGSLRAHDGSVAAWVSVRGVVRAGNEDAVAVVPGTSGEVLVACVADGVGGQAAGEVASQAAIEAATSAMGSGRGAVRARVRAAVRAANAAVIDAQHRERARMATTLTLVGVSGRDVVIGHVGDSRAYRVGDERIHQLTQDHTQAAELLRAGLIDQEEAARHPARSVLTRSLGAQMAVAPDLVSVALEDGERILVCSDGFWGTVPRGALFEALRGAREPDALEGALWRLVGLAYEAGAPDNVSVIVVIPSPTATSSGASVRTSWWRRSRGT